MGDGLVCEGRDLRGGAAVFGMGIRRSKLAGYTENFQSDAVLQWGKT